MNRLIIRECDQFPEIAAAFYEAAIQRTTDAMAGWLRRQCERGDQARGSQVVAGMLRGMMIMEPQRAVMLGLRIAPDPDEIVARAKQCARLFLQGCSVR
jgi:AefR-like transcriptional repressor, C-terminal domain